MHTLKAISGTKQEETVNVSNPLTHMDVIDLKENWKFSFNTCEENNNQERELTDISIRLPNGWKWTGTIMCFASIYPILVNACREIQDALIMQQGEMGYVCETTEDSKIELDSLLMHFQKEKVDPVSEMAIVQMINNSMLYANREIQDVANKMGNAPAMTELQRAADCISDAMSHIKKSLSLIM